MDKQQLAQIIEDLKDVAKDKGMLNISDDVLFDCAVRIYNSSRIPAQSSPIKTFGRAQPPGIRDARSLLKTGDSPTEKQLFFLKQQGIQEPELLTKQEAIQLIKQLKEQQ